MRTPSFAFCTSLNVESSAVYLVSIKQTLSNFKLNKK